MIRIKTEKLKWTMFFCLCFVSSGLLLKSRKSMQKDVVSDARAESALAYEEAMMPNKKKIPAMRPIRPGQRGKSSSATTGSFKLLAVL